MSQAPFQLRGPFCNSAGCYLEIPELFQTESKLTLCCCYCSIAKSCLTLRPYGLQHARLPCPSQTEFVLPEFVQIHVHCVGDVIQPSHPLSPLLLLPSAFPSIRIFSKELALCIRWQKDCSFSFSISPSNEYSELISFRIDWFDLLAVQGTVKSLLQHHSSKAAILWHSVHFMATIYIMFIGE